MAVIDQVNEKIIFDKAEELASWKNAPVLENLDQNQFRLCYLCKLRMEWDLSLENSNKDNKPISWVVDLINVKTLDLSLDNLVAIHYGCLANRKKLNQTKLLKNTKSLLWKYNEE